MRPDYDVIIVGGRPSGSTLAARLGKQRLRVLLLDRTEFPSLPAVSCPMINAATLEMLDEIGADEAAYARGTPKIRRMVQVLGPGLSLPFDLPQDTGRGYGYAVDRARFDAALWETAVSSPTVEGRLGFSVTGLLVESGRVVGIAGHGQDKQAVELRASLTVGADGRHSLVARTMGAAERMRHDEHPTSILYAYWRGVLPFDATGPVASAYGGPPGLGYLLMDSADGTCGVVAEGRADLFDDPDRAGHDLYLHFLQQQPDVWARLEGAEMVTTVRGMKRIGNLYRQPGGPGWALVGDAYMQQDPLDGQGIYNAVFTAKALAWAIRQWRAGDMTWSETLDWYDETVQIRTYSMYRQLLERIGASLYASMPEAVAQRLARWMADDDLFRTTFARFITRRIPAEAMRLLTPGLIARAAARGLVLDAIRGLRRRIG